MQTPEELFQFIPAENRVYTYINPPKNRAPSPFIVYPISELHRLIAARLAYSQKLAALADPFEDDPWRISYIVDRDYKMWFAAKTNHTQRTPAHHQMTGKVGTESKCIAAGYIYFTEGFASILKIDHSSSDFNPSFQSLQWPLAILIANRPDLEKNVINFPDIIQIPAMDNPLGNRVLGLSSSKLQTWLLNTFQTLPALWNQPSEIKEISPPIPLRWPALGLYPPAPIPPHSTVVILPPPSPTKDDGETDDDVEIDDDEETDDDSEPEAKKVRI